VPGTFSNLQFHVVFSTKDRKRWLTSDLQRRLYDFIGGIIRGEKGVLHEIGGMPDHVDLLIGWRTDESLAALMRNVKSRSSLWVHQTFPQWQSFAWQAGYGPKLHSSPGGTSRNEEFSGRVCRAAESAPNRIRRASPLGLKAARHPPRAPFRAPRRGAREKWGRLFQGFRL